MAEQLTEGQRRRLVEEHRHLRRQVGIVRQALNHHRAIWANETRPQFREWMEFVGDDPEQWASGHLMDWMAQTGRRMGSGELDRDEPTSPP